MDRNCPASTARLAVAMIVRDEADVLADSLESVRSIADEIVVLDTGSTDQTPEVAQRLGATLARMTWNDSFAAARNRCLKRVSADWILWLDAGERLDPHTASELGDFVRCAADPNKAYWLMVEIPPLEPGNSAEQAARIRLMPRRDELRFEGLVRESLRGSLEAAGMTVDLAPGRILRHPRQHDAQRKARRAQRDLALANLEADETGSQPPRLLLTIGDALSDRGDAQAARRTYRAAIAAAVPGSTELLEAYYGLLSSLDVAGQPQLHTAACLEALEAFPLDAQLLLAAGHSMQAGQRPDLAARSFELAVRHGQVNLETWHLCELREVAAVCLGLTLQLQGQDQAARRVLEEALHAQPRSARVRRPLLDLLLNAGCEDEALDLAVPLEADRGSGLANAIRGACQAARGDWTAALGYLQSAYLEGCQDVLCLRWLAVTLLSHGQLSAAEPVLRQWQQLEPRSPELQAYLQAVAGAAEAPPAESDAEGRHLRLDRGLPSADRTAAPTAERRPELAPGQAQRSRPA